MSFHRESIYKARKEYACEWCGKKIKENEKYCYQVGTKDDNIEYMKLHLNCKSKLDKAKDDLYPETDFTFDDLYEHYYNYIKGNK